MWRYFFSSSHVAQVCTAPQNASDARTDCGGSVRAANAHLTAAPHIQLPTRGIGFAPHPLLRSTVLRRYSSLHMRYIQLGRSGGARRRPELTAGGPWERRQLASLPHPPARSLTFVSTVWSPGVASTRDGILPAAHTLHKSVQRLRTLLRSELTAGGPWARRKISSSPSPELQLPPSASGFAPKSPSAQRF
jgi:hypothetical protein